MNSSDLWCAGKGAQYKRVFGTPSRTWLRLLVVYDIVNVENNATTALDKALDL